MKQMWRDAPIMNHAEWLEWRRGGLGSSDSPVIMGVSPWKTPMQLWEEKVYGKVEQIENPAMTYGKEMEEIARRDFEELMDVSLFPKNIIHHEHDFLRASLDGIDMDGKICVEIKWPNREDHERAKAGYVPDKYIPQVQKQLLVADLKDMFYYSCYKDERIVVEVSSNSHYIKEMFDKECFFWDLVKKKECPEPTERDFLSFEDDLEWSNISEYWKLANADLKEAESKCNHLKKLMIEHSQNRNAKGFGVKLAKSICKGAIDYKTAIDRYIGEVKAKFPDLQLPDLNLEDFRKEAFTKWTIRTD